MVIDPDGNQRVVPEDTRKQIEQMNKFAPPGKQYKVYPYDPKNPNAIPQDKKSDNFTETVSKLANENAKLKKELEEMKKKAETSAKTEDKGAKFSDLKNKPKTNA